MTSQSGNAFVITLLSIVLLGALTFVLSRQMGGTSLQSASDEQVELYANGLIATANQYSFVLEQMMQSGVHSNQSFNFMLPSDPDFNTGTTIYKVHHPAGGGMMPPKPVPAEMSDGQGTGIGFSLDEVEWMSSDPSNILVLYSLSAAVCGKINKILTGSETIPSISSFNTDYFIEGGNAYLNATQCPGCDGKPMLCMYSPDENQHIFYAVLYSP